MKTNNKLSRKRAEKSFVTQQDGTEVLHSHETRIKQRRWSFVADVAIRMPDDKNEETGVTTPGVLLPPRSLKLESVSYGSTKDVHGDCQQNEAYLRASSPLFARADIKVYAVPHETVSDTTIRQIMGYRDMSNILDKALELAIEDLKCFDKSTSVSNEATEASAAEMPQAKEIYYKKALDMLRPKEAPSDTTVDEPTQVLGADGETNSEIEEERPKFEPEIIEIQKS